MFENMHICTLVFVFYIYYVHFIYICIHICIYTQIAQERDRVGERKRREEQSLFSQLNFSYRRKYTRN